MTMLCKREDVDIGWGMLGVDNQTLPPTHLKEYIAQAQRGLMELRKQGLQLTYELLGFTHDSIHVPSSLDISTSGSPIKTTCEHLANIRIDWMQVAVTQSARGGERERRLIFEHIRNPTPTVMLSDHRWIRKTPPHLALILESGTTTPHTLTPLRRINLEAEEYTHIGGSTVTETLNPVVDTDRSRTVHDLAQEQIPSGGGEQCTPRDAERILPVDITNSGIKEQDIHHR